jgi:hypothetical protein
VLDSERRDRFLDAREARGAPRFLDTDSKEQPMVKGQPARSKSNKPKLSIKEKQEKKKAKLQKKQMG